MGAFPLQLLLGYLAGTGLALIARAPLSKTWEPLRTRYFSAVLLFAASALGPTSVVLYALFPDWSWMYLVNPDQILLFIGMPMVFVLSVTMPAAGFFVTHRLMRRRPHLLRWSIGGVAGVAFLALTLGAGRLGTVAYYDAFHYGGRQISVFDSPLLLTLSLTVPVVLGSFAFTVMMVRKHIARAHSVGS